MKFRILTAVLAIALMGGCFNDEKKSAKTKKKDETKDQSKDVTFQGFVDHLKMAVQRRDRAMLASLMSPDFGWRWDTPPPGEDPFMYWDQHNLWQELFTLVNSRWVPHEGFMVVPAQMATDANYGGYRAGVQQVRGSWRFTYFVPAPPPEQQ